MRASILLLILFLFTFCSEQNQSEQNQQSPPPQNERMGAIYISCEPPSWVFNFDDLFVCEQTEPAIEELNPDNSCPISDIQTQNGEIEILFSDDISLGRILVRINGDDVLMEDMNSNQVSEIYLNNHDEWFLLKNEIRLKLTIVNVYVGNCYHELIQWEELPMAF